MFELLSDKLHDAFRGLTGKSVLTEKNISDAMSDVRRALLEADVNYEVVKDFVAQVRQECLGEKVLRSVKPGEQATKVVHDHLVTLLGEENAPLELTGKPAVVMMVGLHGSGKTTTSAKLAKRLRDRDGQNVMLAACDLHRPAAIDQLEILGRDLDVPVYSDRDADDIAKLAIDARNAATAQGVDILILDTAGRHQVDDVLVQQLVEMKRRAQPCEIILVGDAALGQEAVSVAEHFDQALGITGLILTKMDGDARGGAALSMRQVTGRPIKFMGVGEGMEDIEPFHPDRLASRILGMGDVVSLVEKASEQYEEEEAAKLEEKIRKQTFDFEDFRSQLKKLKRMGGLLSMLDMLPGMGKIKEKLPIDERQFNRVEAIIGSMTPEERGDPKLLKSNGSRKRRIALGSGVQISEVNDLVGRFDMMRQMMGNMDQMQEMMSAMGGGGLGGGMPGLGGMGGGMPSIKGMPAMPGLGGGGQRHGTKGTKKKKKKRKKNKR
jgi:signal recognition particle subunit SRP54